MNWFQELQTCHLNIFAGVAVDAYRRLNRPDSPVSLTEFLHEASELLVRRQEPPPDRFRILLALCYELGDGRITTVDRVLGPVIKEIEESGDWLVSLDDDLGSFGLARRARMAERDVTVRTNSVSVGKVTYLKNADERDVEGRVVIVTALDKEFEAFRSFIGGEDQPSSLRGLRTSTRLPGSDIILVGIGDAGNVPAALATKQAIDRWNPGLVILAGITGGFANSRADLELGDVLVPREIVGYEQAKLLPGEINYRIKVGRVGGSAMALARDVAQDTNWFDTRSYPPGLGFRVPRAHFDGSVLSGEKVVADAFQVSQLKALWGDSMGTEMESIGLMIAAYNAISRPEVLFLKSVCDWADESKADDYQHFASFASASFAIAVAERWVAKYPNVARPGLQYRALSDLNGFWRSVDDRDALVLCHQLGIDQFEYRAWRRGDHSLQLVEFLQRHHRVNELVDAVLAVGRPELLQFVLGGGA